MLGRTTMITTAAIALAVSLPASAGAQQDLRNPDRRDPVSNAQRQDLRNPDNRGTVSAPAPRDLRSPDAVDASRGVGIYASKPQDTGTPQDIRTPDAVDASRRVGIYSPSPDPVTTVSAPASSSGGFDWGDAGIGAAGMLGLLSLAAGTLMIGAQLRRRRRFAAH